MISVDVDKIKPRALSFLRNLGLAFLPGFLHPNNDSAPSDGKKSRLLVLEGLRGLACLVVFNYHLFKNLVGGPTSERSTWFGQPSFFQWPWIYMFFNGRAMVFTFWVLSGYAMSFKAVKLLHQGDSAGCNTALASSLIRRGFRLFLPPVAGVLIIGFFCWLQVFEPARLVRHDPIHDNYLALLEEVPPSSIYFFEQMNHAFWASLNVMNIMGGYNEHPGEYNDTYWVIPVQYRASLFVYLVLLANSRMKSHSRTILNWSLTILTFFWHRIDFVTHFGGLALVALDVVSSTERQEAEIELELSKDEGEGLLGNDRTEVSRFHQFKTILHRINQFIPYTIINCFLFLLGTLLLSVTGAEPQSQALSSIFTNAFPFIMWNNNDGPGIIGALLTIYSLLRLPKIHFLLTNRVMLYLGKISFSLYLVHGVIIRGWTYAILPWIYRSVGIAGNLDKPEVTRGQVLGTYSLALLLTLPVIIWISDLFWRYVEVGSEKIGRWVEEKIRGEK